MERHDDSSDISSQPYADPDGLDLRNQIQESYSSRERPWFRWLLKRLDLPGEGRLLELGSGPGDLWLEDPTVLLPGVRLLLSDMSAGMLVEARRRLSEANLHPAYIQLDAQALALDEASCDGIVGIGFLDHMLERSQALSEIRRVLKPGGRFYVTAGGERHLQELKALVQPFRAQAVYGGEPEQFGLENGADLLSPYFEQVRLERYPDELVFSHPEPVMAYILSEPQAAQALDSRQRAGLNASIAAEIERRGELRVTISKGLFEAQ